MRFQRGLGIAPEAPIVEGGPGHSWRRTLFEVPPPTGGGNTRRPCHPSREHPPMNSSPNAPGKGGRERSERWRETLKKGFPPRVSDGTGSPGGEGRCQGLFEIPLTGPYKRNRICLQTMNMIF